MADDPHNTSDIETGAAKEDAETTAARRELKQTSISEKAGHAQQLSQDDKSASDDDAPQDKAPPRRVTPDITLGPPREEVLREQISSPKKKRAHDELDENKDVAETPLEEGAPPKPAATGATQSRTDRSEPEKKRPRDRQASASAVKSGQEEVVRVAKYLPDVLVLTHARSLYLAARPEDRAWSRPERPRQKSPKHQQLPLPARASQNLGAHRSLRLAR
jgi:hypothetical protein